MALTIPLAPVAPIGLDEYLERVADEVDVHDLDSVAASAPLLSALAGDRELVVSALNRLVETQFREATQSSAQSLFLGRRPGFYVRANIWPSAADVASGRLYQDQFSYDIAHDHNYDFLTVPYHGPGYVTEIYEYDPDRVVGYPGEAVDLHFLERAQLVPGRAMLYRASRDVHTQFPPEDLSISLNLMLEESSAGRRDQFYFDLAAKRLVGFAGEQDSSRRVTLLRIAGHAGDEETQGLLSDLARKHPCRRTRIEACESLVRLAPAERVAIWEQACRDADPLVRRIARERLSRETG